MIIVFFDKEQIWQHEQTRYWFGVDGVNWCISDTNGDLQLLDFQGYPVSTVLKYNLIFNTLCEEYKKYIND